MIPTDDEQPAADTFEDVESHPGRDEGRVLKLAEQTQTTHRILVAGIGNIFMGDDGFGCEVVRRLAGTQMPKGVVVVDYGIRGMHLAYDLLQSWSQLILIDALPYRGSPGELQLIEVGPEHLGSADVDPHGMGPDAMLSSLGALGGQIPPAVLVGAEVSDISDRIGLSPQVEAAVPAAVDAIRSLLEQLLDLAPDLSNAEVG